LTGIDQKINIIANFVPKNAAKKARWMKVFEGKGF